MKNVLLVFGVLALSLTLGVAYASSDVSNGITYFDTGPVCDCWSVRYAAAGGMLFESEALSNGITSFELAPVDSVPIGLCAASIYEETPTVNNGVTYFGESW